MVQEQDGKPIKLYGLKTCTACNEAEKILKSKNISYEYVEPEDDIGMLPQMEVNGKIFKGLGRINRYIREGY